MNINNNIMTTKYNFVRHKESTRPQIAFIWPALLITFRASSGARHPPSTGCWRRRSWPGPAAPRSSPGGACWRCRRCGLGENILVLWFGCKNICHSPVWPPDSPRVPRGCTASSSHLAFSLSTDSAVQPGRSTCTEARMPVPRLVGQEWM